MNECITSDILQESARMCVVTHTVIHSNMYRCIYV